METTKKEYRYLEIVDNVATSLLTLEQAYERTKTLTTPAPVILAGSPRVLVGKATATGLDMEYGVFNGAAKLVEVISRTPDAIRFRGGNYRFVSNGVKEAGLAMQLPATAFDGRALPAGTARPAGYFLRFFPDAGSEQDYYWQLGDSPDEVFKPKVVTKPTNPIVVTPTPEPPKGNQNVTTTYTLGDLLVGSQAQ